MWCEFCVTEDQIESFQSDEAQKLLDDLVHKGYQTVIFGGGEPFLWKGDLLQLCQAAKDRSLFVQIGTNAIRLPSQFEMIPFIDRFVLPLESMESEVHNLLRKAASSHHTTILEALKKLKSAQRSATISTVVTKQNVDGLHRLALFLANEHSDHLHAWHLYQFLPIGRGGSQAQGLQLSEDEYLAATQAIQRLSLPFKVFRRTNMYASKTVSFFWKENGTILSNPAHY